MQDFIGNELAAGDYVAAGGSGNGSAEYGMILYQVLDTSPKLKLVRLVVDYPTYSADYVEVTTRKITVQNPNKYVKVYPSPDIVILFSNALQDTLTMEQKIFIGKWISGGNHSIWD